MMAIAVCQTTVLRSESRRRLDAGTWGSGGLKCSTDSAKSVSFDLLFEVQGFCGFDPVVRSLEAVCPDGQACPCDAPLTSHLYQTFLLRSASDCQYLIAFSVRHCKQAAIRRLSVERSLERGPEIASSLRCCLFWSNQVGPLLLLDPGAKASAPDRFQPFPLDPLPSRASSALTCIYLQLPRSPPPSNASCIFDSVASSGRRA